jgi:2,3-bisphosphoglycerate-dependent phosphoglycerate mutase
VAIELVFETHCTTVDNEQGRGLGDLPTRWDGRRILVIGHVATRWGLDRFIGGVPLEDLIEQDFAWQEGWEYRVS